MPHPPENLFEKAVSETRQLGQWGEERIAALLQARGYEILCRNWRCRWGELDLVARRGEYLCFVEVKLRRSASFAPARSFVTGPKQQRLRLAAACYLTQYDTGLQPRFDVAEVYAPQGTQTRDPVIQYWENAF